MNIRELIESTNKVKNREQGKALSKKFGAIYAYDKRVSLMEGGRVINITMTIGGATEFVKKGDRKELVPYHNASIAINVGRDGRTEYTADELVSAIRRNHSEYRDTEKWVPQDVLNEAEKNPGSFFDNATIFKASKGGGYVVVKNEISEDAPIQVWCSCSDYYWTFQYYNMQAPVTDIDGKSLGSVNLYASSSYPKTYNYRSEAGKKSKAPLRNPGRHPGMCKHLMLLLAMLMKDNVVKEKDTTLGTVYELDYSKFLENNVKERVSDIEYQRMMKQYRDTRRDISYQRNLIHYASGNKTERKFQSESQDLKIFNESADGNSMFNPISQERKFKSKGTFNRNTGRHTFPKRKRK